MKSSDHVGRRDFFRRVLLKGMNRLEQAGRSVGLRMLGGGEDGRSAGTSGRGGDTRNFLRPPGALDESAFAQTCSRCGDCVRVCPAQCIVIDEAVRRGIAAHRATAIALRGVRRPQLYESLPNRRVEPWWNRLNISRWASAQMDHARCLRNPLWGSGVPHAIDDG